MKGNGKTRKGAFIFSGLYLFFIGIRGLLSFSGPILAESNPSKDGIPKIFLECPDCDLEFMKSQVPFVHYVSDLAEAQVQVVITSEETERGKEYTFSFRGQNEFEGENDVLKYLAGRKAPPDEVKKGLSQMLSLGLMRYAGKMPVASRLSVDLIDVVKPTAVEDRWNFWVFSLSANSFLNGEQSYKDGMYFGSFSANRVTPDIKIRLAAIAMYQRNRFAFEDQVYDSSTDGQEVRGLVVKSINDHWSVGGYFSAHASSYSNIRFAVSPAPAIEFDLFPYSECTRKQLRFLYRLNFISATYLEKTIYGKTSERLWQESLSATLELNQKWGTISTSLEGSNYFHDTSKNRLELWGELSVRIFEGFNFNVHGGYSAIHDQLSLPASGASLEEILLRRKQLETSYYYHFSVGLSYTFGSTRSRVVNPRFGDGGSGISVNIGI